MKKGNYIAIMLFLIGANLAAISVNSVALPQENSTDSADQLVGYSVLDHTMASEVQEFSPYDVLHRTNTFSTENSRAYSWLSFGKLYGSHQLEWRWYSPEDRLFGTYSKTIPNPEPNYEFWEWYKVYGWLDIAGYDAANKPGNWYVDIYIDGQKLLTENFSITASGQKTAEDWYKEGNDLAEEGEYNESIQA
jgi:hypothetical protein